MDGNCKTIYNPGNEVIPVLFPLLHLCRILNRTDIDPTLLLKPFYTMITIAIIILGIFPVHNQTIFVPESPGQDYIRVADIIQVNAIHLLKAGNL